LISDWLYNPRTLLRIIFLSYSTIIICLIVIYLLWWYITGQKFVYL
jgi:hypothetical protein